MVWSPSDATNRTTTGSWDKKRKTRNAASLWVKPGCMRTLSAVLLKTWCLQDLHVKAPTSQLCGPLMPEGLRSQNNKIELAISMPPETVTNGGGMCNSKCHLYSRPVPTITGTGYTHIMRGVLCRKDAVFATCWVSTPLHRYAKSSAGSGDSLRMLFIAFVL